MYCGWGACYGRHVSVEVLLSVGVLFDAVSVTDELCVFSLVRMAVWWVW